MKQVLQLALAISVVMGAIYFLQRQVSKRLEDVYQLIQQQNTTLYVVMDTEVRIFHYAKPHKHPVRFCPECFDLKRRLFQHDSQRERRE